MPNKPRFLIIDPEEAFHPGGPLAVKGANEDSKRIIEMLTVNSDAEVYVSLDSHTIQHIGHYGFWKRKDATIDEDEMKDLQGNPIEFSAEKESLFIQPPEKKEDGAYIKPRVYIEAINPNLRKYAINYVKTLRGNKVAMDLGKAPMLWPTHCVIGDKFKGRAIYPPLFKALEGIGNVKYYKKGENELAEMYSIFKSELQPRNIENGLTAYFNGKSATSPNLTGNVDSKQINKIQDGKEEEEGAYLNTEFNAGDGSLYSELIKDATQTEPVDIYICGEALSHCVNYSLRDLVEKLKNDNQQHVKVHLVLNCSSTVVLTGIETFFFGNSVQLIDDILGEYNKYCDIVFWDGREVVPNPDMVKTTKGVFDIMSKEYDETAYQKYLDIKDIIRGVATYIPSTENGTGEKAKGGKRTKKKRRSKTQKKRKGQIKKSKRHRRSRK